MIFELGSSWFVVFLVRDFNEGLWENDWWWFSGVGFEVVKVMVMI